jgi:hypothetical protein
MYEIVSRNRLDSPLQSLCRLGRLPRHGELSIAVPLKSDGVGGLPKNERDDGKVS